MNTLIIIFVGLAGIFALLLIIALFIKKEHFVRREIIINASVEKVFDFVKLLKNQDRFNRHAMAGSERKREFKGTDGTVGYIYSWSGDKDSGVGEKEIMDIIEEKRIETEIRFTKPMAAVARIIMETEALPDARTKVSWSNGGSLKYPVNLFIPMMERSVAKDMDASLLTLRNILEN